jgi:cell division protein FtsQ
VADRRWRLVRAGRDAVPESVRRFNARARRNRLRVARPWLISAGVVLVLAITAAVLYWTPAVSVRELRVRGTAVVTEREVRDAAAVRPGTPLLQVDVAGLRSRVAQIAPIRSVDITRRPPSTLEIRVTERTAVAVVENPGGRWLLDGTGVAYLPAPVDNPGLVLVKLATPNPTDATTRAALAVLAALTRELREPLAALVAEAPARIRLELTDGRTVVWGDSSENDAKARVAAVMLGKPGRVIDVSAPEFVTVR